MTSNKYAMITDIAFLNSNAKKNEDFMNLFNNSLFDDHKKWNEFKLSSTIDGLMDGINSRMKYFMSILSLGVYNALENGPGKNLKKEEEIYLFSGFTEIGTVSKIGDMIMTQNYSINPSVFPNSVHHISLCYYGILKKITNYCAAITDGLLTNFSFISFIKNRIQLDDAFVVVTGEENASFFSYEISDVLKIVPSFASYRIIPNSERGFRYLGEKDSLYEIKNMLEYKESSSIFADQKTFFDLQNIKDKKVYTDYPITQDNPCGIAFRIAFPFYFNLKGKSLIIDKIDDKYFCFEVNL